MAPNAEPMPRNRYGTTDCRIGETIVKAVMRRTWGTTAAKANDRALGIEYWIGTTTATGRIRKPTRRRALAGSSRKRAS